MSDYDSLLALREEADAAARKATAAEGPWKEMAHKIALETRGIQGDSTVRFEKERFRILCQGTGIHSDEQWWESFPAELLINKMRESVKGPSDGK